MVRRTVRLGVVLALLSLGAGMTAPAAMALPTSTAGVLRPGPGGFVAMTPNRILDTRNGNVRFRAGEIRTLTVTGPDVNLPPAGSGAVVLNITAVRPDAGFVSVWPADHPSTNTSVLNFDSQQTVANAVTVRLSSAGQIKISSSSVSDLIVDITGWFAAPALGQSPDGQYRPVPTGGGGFFGIAPTRVLDTRSGQHLTANHLGALNVSLPVDLAGTTVGSLVINVTAVRPGGAGFLTVYGLHDGLTDVSNLNYGGHSAVANQVTVHVGGSNSIGFYSSADVDLIVDIMGFYTEGAPIPGGYSAVRPQRLIDTRRGQPLGNISFDPRTREWDLGIAGTAGVPASASSVSLNVTALGATRPGFVTVWPDGQDPPTSSTLNLAGGDVVANAVTSGLGSNNGVSITTDTDAVFLIDLFGWFCSPFVAG